MGDHGWGEKTGEDGVARLVILSLSLSLSLILLPATMAVPWAVMVVGVVERHGLAIPRCHVAGPIHHRVIGIWVCIGVFRIHHLCTGP